MTSKRLPVATLSLTLVLVVAHLIALWAGNDIVRKLDFVPATPWRLYGLSFLTSTLLHMSWAHLCTNVALLYFYGVHAENRLGWLKFLLLFFFSAAFGHAVYALIFSTAMRHSLGASGGVFGVMAFYSFYLRRDRLASMAKRLRIPSLSLGLLARLKRQAMKFDSVFIVFWVCIAREVIGLGTQITGATHSNSAAHLGGALFGALGCLFWPKKRLRADRNRSKNISGHHKATCTCVAILLLTPLSFVAAREGGSRAGACPAVAMDLAAFGVVPLEIGDSRPLNGLIHEAQAPWARSGSFTPAITATVKA
jgi:membrane associated rhomboid family serine protease